MRICNIISGDLWAGAEVMYYHLLKGLRKYGDVEILSILFNDGKLAKEIRNLGVDVKVLDEKSMSNYQIASNICKFIKEASPDIVHSHRFKENILAYISVKNNKNVKLICTQHGKPEPTRFKYKILKSVVLSKYNIYIISKCFDRVVAVSDDLKNYMLKTYNFEMDKINVIHNGIEMPCGGISRKYNKVFVIGSAGRLYKVKDYPLFVEVAREILKQVTSVRFELAGDGPEKENILKLIYKYKMEEYFKLTGFVNDMNAFYEGLDLYVNTSLHEGLPMSILEAMAYGLPVIAPNCGGIPEILDADLRGCLVEGRDPKDYAKKCIRLYEDKEYAKTMGIASINKIIDKYSIEHMTSSYYKLYDSILHH